MTSTYGDGGAGGKLKRPPQRRHHTVCSPPTQLSKSQLNPTGDAPTPAVVGWLSRIVDPARRLISTGATRFLPSVFSYSSSSAAAADIPSLDPCPSLVFGCSRWLDESSNGDADCDEQDQETDRLLSTRNWRNAWYRLFQLGSSRLLEDAGHIRLDNLSNFDRRQENTDGIDKESGLSEIEQLMRGKLFSRDEANRLTEILHLKDARNSDD